MWEGGEQSLKKRQFSKTLDSPSVRACLLLRLLIVGGKGLSPYWILFMAPGASLPSVCPWMDGWGMWTLPAAGTGMCCGSGAGRGRDRQPWSPERPCRCRHQVPDRRQRVRDLRLLRDPGPLPPAPPPCSSRMKHRKVQAWRNNGIIALSCTIHFN